ncbi:MAG TPA: TIGR02450 family Trp-rich protein [Pseudomonas xinjiangensis]|uniref:TIGR02450 family Trp-rich protein n=2 Tax=root TaxID=1 RepID=A0A7V1BMG5_9GAMM|nr:TIGR02450 family Trp-rich protein [Halopseudomonas xinjiangensis]HEC49235.1 TIGR02450 family Trp-rich protein [Halopseudomonas xinjiangensis]
MNRINPRKLLHSKWTAVLPTNKEVHFMVIDCHLDEQNNPVAVDLEAILTRRIQRLPWRLLKDSRVWKLGWR